MGDHELRTPFSTVEKGGVVFGVLPFLEKGS